MRKKISLFQETHVRQRTPSAGKQKTTAFRLFSMAVMLCMVLTILPIFSVPVQAADTQLATPQNLTWDGPVAKWDAVANADRYSIILAGGGNPSGGAISNIPQYNFVRDMTPGETYIFYVQALDTSSNYATSERSASSGTYTMETRTPPTVITSVIWNADYSVTFTTDTHASGAIYSYALVKASDDSDIRYGDADYEGSLSVSGNSATISAARVKGAMTSVKEDGEYYIEIYFVGNYSSAAKSATRTLTALPQLATPQNLTWNGPVAKWDAVANADMYTLWLYLYEGDSRVTTVVSNSSQYNFASSMTPGETYYFYVQARDTSSNYANSEGSADSGNYTMETGTPDTTAPTITAVTPNGAGAAVSGDVVITFSEEMDTGTAGAVLLNSTATLGGTWSHNNTTYTVHYTGLAYSTFYTVNISGFGDAAGNIMTADSSRNFTTTVESAGALTGTAAISNTAPKVGDALTGSLVGGNNTGTLTYIWKADGSTVGSGSSYTVQAADLGKAITLEITSSVQTGSVVSAATAPVVMDPSVTPTVPLATVPPTPAYASGNGGSTQNSFRVLFETSGGGYVAPVTGLSYGDRITAPAAPVKDGYTFGGWYRNEACTVVWTFADVVPGDITLYAKWISSSAAPTTTATVTTTIPTTVITTTKPTVTATMTATTTESPAATEAPAPVFGVFAGLGVAGVMMRRPPKGGAEHGRITLPNFF